MLRMGSAWRFARAAMAVGLCLGAGVALARPVTYQCDEELQIKIDFTPRQAQLHLPDKDVSLVRIKSANDAHYVNRKAGVSLVAKKGDLTLTQGKQKSQCKLQVRP